MSDEHRYARHLVLPGVGSEGQKKLDQARVLVIGAGGLGSPLLLYLAAAGVGRIGIVDDDVVSLSNLQRQVIHSSSAIGEKKVNSAKRRLEELNDEIQIDAFDVRLTPNNAIEILGGGWDVVVDGCDNLPTRYLVDDACSLLELPWVYGSIYRFEGQVSVFNFNGGPCYRDLFSNPPPSDAVPSCADGGVLGVLPGVIGSLQANEVIKLILGLGDPLNGRLLVYDAEAMEFNQLRFERNPDRIPSSNLDEVEAMFESPEWCLHADPRRLIQEGGASDGTTMFESISMANFIARRAEGWAPYILDVRSLMEYHEAHVSSCDHQVPHESVVSSLDVLPKDNDIVIHCRSGMRSQLAAMLLIQAGMNGSKLYNLEGGILAWQAALPEEIMFS
tara:strand:- start:6722 stop:7888 length:1167 start_codon:yes stop_codon:yes gene_type:complete